MEDYKDQKRAKGVALVCGIPGIGDSMIVNHYNAAVNHYNAVMSNYHIEEHDVETGTVDANNWNRLARIEAKNIGAKSAEVTETEDECVKHAVEECIKYAKEYQVADHEATEFDAKWALGYFFSALKSEQYQNDMQVFYKGLGGAERKTLEQDYNVHNYEEYIANLQKTLVTGKDAHGNVVTDFRPACGGDPIDQFGPFRLFVETACWNSAVRTGYLAHLKEANQGVRLSGSFGQYKQDIKMLDDLNKTEGVDPVLEIDLGKQAYGSLAKESTQLIFVDANTTKDPMKTQIIKDALDNLMHYKPTDVLKGPQTRGRYEGIISRKIEQVRKEIPEITVESVCKANQAYMDYYNPKTSEKDKKKISDEDMQLAWTALYSPGAIVGQLFKDQERIPLLAKNRQMAQDLDFQVLHITEKQVDDALKMRPKDAFERVIADAIGSQHSCRRTTVEHSRGLEI